MLIIVSDRATEVEDLKSALAQAKEQARASQAAANKAAAALEAKQVTRRKYEERVKEVEQELQDAFNKCETLEEKNKVQADDLTKALQEAKEARTESRGACEEIKQAKQIKAGKPFLLQSIFGGQRYALLNRLRSSLDAFANLPRSATDVIQYFQAEKGNATEKLFWSQYLAPEQPALLNNQMMQLAKLHRMSGLAMKDLIVRLWPVGPIPSSYFSLVKRLDDALPRVMVVKCSAFARVKMHWVKMKAAVVAVKGPPEGKDNRKLERYFEDVLEGARLIEGQCSKDIMFE